MTLIITNQTIGSDTKCYKDQSEVPRPIEYHGQDAALINFDYLQVLRLVKYKSNAKNNTKI